MEGERCETITLICLWLLLGVIQKDVTMKMPTKVLRITNEVQTNVEVRVPNNPKEGPYKFPNTKDNPPPPRVN